MQPYVFPYIGYFQLVHAVDTFVFYDDVNFIKQGWINRNRVLLNGEPFLFTIPVEQISSFKEIRHVNMHERNYKIWSGKFLKSLSLSYSKAPFFTPTYNLVQNVLASNVTSISDLAEATVKMIFQYLGINKKFLESSIDFSESKGMEPADRLIAICNKLNAEQYINPIGGVELYDKAYFKNKGIDLSFLKAFSNITYKQGSNKEFVPWLSIIDVMMFNSKEEIRAMLNLYTLE